MGSTNCGTSGVRTAYGILEAVLPNRVNTPCLIRGAEESEGWIIPPACWFCFVNSLIDQVLSDVKDDGHRAIVFNLHQHVSTEFSSLGGYSQLAQHGGKALHQRACDVR